MLSTALTERFALRYPIVNAPMAPQAGGTLARAVSGAGGLGFVGADLNGDPAVLRGDVADARAAEALPLGIGFLGWVLEKHPVLLDVAIES
ncbi:MAG TPA: hypothetical protein VGN14_08100, partial [Candidatus Elarobacter sp.]